MMLFQSASRSHNSELSQVRDQADGLRQLRRIDDPQPADALQPTESREETHIDEGAPETIAAHAQAIQAASNIEPCVTNIAGQLRVLPWPRVVVVSEFPSTDVGARFAWHLVQSLSGGPAGNTQNLLIDLAPAASRLPHVLADCIPSTGYAPLWSQLASGRPLTVQPARLASAVAVAAESQTHPCPFDQLPRVYEQLVRQLSRNADRWRWIVLLAMDSVVPLDRACWQAADDVILLHGAESTGCQRQAAVMRNRIEEDDPRRCIWTLPKRRAGWRSILEHSLLRGMHDVALSTRWLEAGIATQLLPSVAWPEPVYGVASGQQLREGSRVDRALARSARGVADALRLSAACQNAAGVASFDDPQKKIQLGPHLRPIRTLTDEFRA